MRVDKFSQTYHIKSYECDSTGTLRLITLMNIFQDVADSHASNLGIGIEHCLANGLAWVASNYHIKIFRMPHWHENITVTSWPSEERKLGAVRDFSVQDEAGKTIIVATSMWILIDYARKRPVSLRDNLPQYTVVTDRALVSDFSKLSEPERADFTRRFVVRYDDIDVNHHVNNAIYPLWASESLDKDFRSNNRPQELEIAFKKEGLYGEEVIVVTMVSEQTSLHSIKASDDGRELAKVKIFWQHNN